jgi:Copper amine oxidase, enzyme domain
METGSDTGTFLGVGVSLHRGEVELVSEMEAGWYRYISRWRLGLDGVIRPRFGFAATESECVCNLHHHHAYWRFDFDIRTPAHNRVREFNDPPPAGGGTWSVTAFETHRRRDPARSRRWLVENTRTGEGYEIRPGADDGVAATEPDVPFGRGDLWILRYRPNQVDDAVVATGPPYEAGIGAWLNGEPVSDHDVVLWYGAHFTHDVQQIGPAEHAHILGPDLQPVRW